MDSLEYLFKLFVNGNGSVHSVSSTQEAKAGGT